MLERDGHEVRDREHRGFILRVEGADARGREPDTAERVSRRQQASHQRPAIEAQDPAVEEVRGVEHRPDVGMPENLADLVQTQTG